jgi:biopolymer transport protein ExbB
MFATPSHARLALLLTLALPTAGLPAQEQAPTTFEQVAAKVQKDLDQGLAELTALREAIATERIPLGKRLSALEAELTQVRAQYQQQVRQLDSRTLDLSNQRNEIKARSEEAAYLSNLLGEYLRNFDSRLHIAERKRYAAGIQAATLAPENKTLTERQVFAAQAAVLTMSLERIEDALGGARFDGTAVDEGGTVRNGSFVLVGPSAVFRSADGLAVGGAEQRLGSLEPAIVPFTNPELRTTADQLVATSVGSLPLDPTLGNAHKMAALEDTLWQHILKGGPVMWPILGIAAAALLVALAKWVALLLVANPSPRRVQALLDAVSQGDHAGSRQAAAAIGGPAGIMLSAGVAHLDQPRELVEEIMFETVLATRHRLNSWLPFVAITSSSAPLLGLLGTVTGIMNTFTLMTAFGTGDPKTLSSGISEALITTEFGLYVAIPSLLLYALLSRKARRIVDRMEQCAVALVNQLGKVRSGDPAPAEEAAA